METFRAELRIDLVFKAKDQKQAQNKLSLAIKNNKKLLNNPENWEVLNDNEI